MSCGRSWALAEELHFGRAADRLGLGRSRLSQIVRELETKVGARLFERTSRHVRLTAVGARLRDNVAEPYAQLGHAFNDARECATGLHGTLRVGVYSRLNCGPRWLAVGQAFKARHPGCEIEIVYSTFDHAHLASLRAGEVDMLAARLPLSEPDITVGPLLSRENRVLLVAKGDPLAERASVSFVDFADRVLPDAPSMPREMIDTFIPAVTPAGRPTTRMTIRSFEDMLLLIASGELVHATVSSFLDHYIHEGVVAVPIRDLPPSEAALVWLTANCSPKVLAFAATVADVLARHGPDVSPAAVLGTAA